MRLMAQLKEYLQSKKITLVTILPFLQPAAGGIVEKKKESKKSPGNLIFSFHPGLFPLFQQIKQMINLVHYIFRPGNSTFRFRCICLILFSQGNHFLQEASVVTPLVFRNSRPFIQDVFHIQLSVWMHYIKMSIGFRCCSGRFSILLKFLQLVQLLGQFRKVLFIYPYRISFCFLLFAFVLICLPP